MPNAPKTPHRQVRLDDDLWTRLGAAAQAAGTDRSAIIRALVAWYLREPGAKAPARPGVATDVATAVRTGGSGDVHAGP